MIYLTLIDPALDIEPPQPCNLTLSDPSQYLAGYDRIVRAIYDGIDLRVLVKDKLVGKWLRVMAQRYGSERIVVDVVTLRSQLQKQIGLDIPLSVTDQQIKDSALLDLNIPAAQGVTFEDHLLEVFFGAFLMQPGGLRRVGELAAGYEPDQWQAALNRPLVRQTYQKWARETRALLHKEERLAEVQLLDWMVDSPDALIRNLFALKVLEGYPKIIGERVLGQLYPDLLKLKLDLHKVPKVLAGNDPVIDEIRLHLREATATIGPYTLDDLLRQVSGWLEIEFDAVNRVLTDGGVTVTPEHVRRVQQKFRPIESLPHMAQALADIDMLVTRQRPSDPNAEWDVDRWIDWACQEYLPYRFWLENTGRLDDDIGDLAGVYSDWLYDSYGPLLYNSHRMAWKALLGKKEMMKAHAGPILVIMIDNLNAKFYPDLQAQLQRQGFYEHQLSYCLSLLPSCTEVSKKALMTGHYAPFSGTAYQKPVEEKWSQELGKKVRYLAGIGDLRAVTERQHDVYFLNYLPIDMVLHQRESDTGVSHAQAIRSYLTSLAQDVQAFALRIGAERNLLVIAISDHGSTRIPKGTVNVIEGKHYRDRAIDEHHRYVSVKDEELEKPPGSAKYDCYVLKRNVYDLETNYLVARRLYRFLPTSDDAYIHGGLSPEETLVPLAVFQPIAVAPKPLRLLLTSSTKLILGAKVDLTFEITNFNSYPCERVVVQLMDANVDGDTATLDTLAQLKRETIGITGRCHRTADVSAKRLQVRVSFTFLGRPWVNDVGIPIEIVELAKPKADLDSLLGE